jgi:hypothetical protein
MGDLRDVAIWSNPQRLTLQPQQAAIQQGTRIGIEQSDQTLIKDWVQGVRLADTAVPPGNGWLKKGTLASWKAHGSSPARILR